MKTSVLLLVTLMTTTTLAQFGGRGGLAGGFTAHAIDANSQANALSLVQTSVQGLNGSYQELLQGSPTLVHYSTQVVAGLNYGFIYKTHSSTNQYECFKIWEALDGKVSVSYHGFGTTLAGAAETCDIPWNF